MNTNYELIELCGDLESMLTDTNSPYDFICEIKEKYIKDTLVRKNDCFNEKKIDGMYRKYYFSLLNLYNKKGGIYENSK